MRHTGHSERYQNRIDKYATDHMPAAMAARWSSGATARLIGGSPGDNDFTNTITASRKF
jgi:hypothetical protein